MTGDGFLAQDAGVLTSTPSAGFSVYGYHFTLTGNCAFAIEGLTEDFGYFASPAEAARGSARAVVLELIEGQPDYDGVPECDASVYTPRNVVYRHNGKRIMDFGGRGLGVYDAAAGHFRIVSADPHLVYEAGYLFLLSQIGQASDARHLHRLHALAMSHRGRSILVLLPMGGGKSTLAAALLKHSTMSILSDDSPFIDRQGNALAFPLRLGMLKGGEQEIPEEHRRLVNRMEFGPKYLVNYSWFADRVTDQAAPGIILLGRRTLAAQGRTGAGFLANRHGGDGAEHGDRTGVVSGSGIPAGSQHAGDWRETWGWGGAECGTQTGWCDGRRTTCSTWGGTPNRTRGWWWSWLSGNWASRPENGPACPI